MDAIELEGRKLMDDLIRNRRAIRAFVPAPVERHDIVSILEVASRAPSGTNMQPWRVYVLTGEMLNTLSQAIIKERLGDLSAHQNEYAYYPEQFFSPYIERRRKVGLELYRLVGIERGDTQAMHEFEDRNYKFFGAPVGIIYTIDRRLEIGSWLDYGMFLQNVMIAARTRGLDTCPQAAFARYHKVIRRVLSLPDEEMVICGMALGYADPQDITSQLQTEREPVAAFTTFLD